MKIQSIEFSGFKSLDDLKLDGLDAFSVFVGPNGSGKSNLVDALAFVSAVLDLGVTKAVKRFGGFSHIHNFRRRRTSLKSHTRRGGAEVFRFRIQIQINGRINDYSMILHHLDQSPQVEEYLLIDGKKYLERKRDDFAYVTSDRPDRNNAIMGLPPDRSALMFVKGINDYVESIFLILTNVSIYRIDLNSARRPGDASFDPEILSPDGRNLADVLANLTKTEGASEDVLELMKLLAPGLVNVSVKNNSALGVNSLEFKEEGVKVPFSVNSISDGTIYALSILTAVVGRSSEAGITVIEEPERGLHPKAIEVLVELMRDKASPEHPIFVTTHSESVVRSCRPEELWLMNKLEGKTVAKNAAKSGGDIGRINLDTAWLMNMFDGGLPW